MSLEPPSDAKPACISTAIASTTCLNLPTLVSQPSSSSFNTFATFRHFLLLFTLLPTTTAATAHATTATVAATPTTTLPISPIDQTTSVRRLLPTLLRFLTAAKRRRFNMHANKSTLNTSQHFKIKGKINKILFMRFRIN